MRNESGNREMKGLYQSGDVTVKESGEQSYTTRRAGGNLLIKNWGPKKCLIYWGRAREEGKWVIRALELS